MLGDVRARKYSKTGARTRSILEKFVFDTTLFSLGTLGGDSAAERRGSGPTL